MNYTNTVMTIIYKIKLELPLLKVRNSNFWRNNFVTDCPCPKIYNARRIISADSQEVVFV